MKLLTVDEVATRLGRNPELIRRWLRSGRLRGQRLGWSWLIRPQDLERFTISQPQRRKR